MAGSKITDNSERIGPWLRLSSECRYENQWIKVFHEEVITPGNTEGIYGRVHFKGTAIGIVPVDEEGNTWLVGQYRYTLNEYSWEIPMGGCPAGEEPINAAKRELAEETGLNAEKWKQIQKLHTSNSITDESGLVYLAKGLEQGEVAHEVTEDITVKKLPLSEAVKWAREGKITDVISVAALLEVWMLYSENDDN